MYEHVDDADNNRATLLFFQFEVNLEIRCKKKNNDSLESGVFIQSGAGSVIIMHE